jgi:formate/nitrite transporter FocA (FNT family)
VVAFNLLNRHLLGMDYIKPADVAQAMIETAAAKAALSVKDLLIRGFLSGALLGFATSLAFVGSKQTGVPLAGALIFPVGFVLIVLLGLELVPDSHWDDAGCESFHWRLVARKPDPGDGW